MNARQLYVGIINIIYMLLLQPVTGMAQEAVYKIITIVNNPNKASNVQNIAVKISTEEVQKRTGLHWKLANVIPINGNVIVLKTGDARIPFAISSSSPSSQKPESFRIVFTQQTQKLNRKILRMCPCSIGILRGKKAPNVPSERNTNIWMSTTHEMPRWGMFA